MVNVTMTTTLATGITSIGTNISSTISPSLGHSCEEFQYDFYESIGLSVVFGLCFFIGLIMIFAGYRLFRFALFIQLFSLVSTITFLALDRYLNLPVLYTGLAAGGGGLAVGLIATFVKTIGLFGIALVQGVFLATCVLYVVHIFTVLDNIYIAPGIVLVCFVVLAMPTLKWEKTVVIFYTASYGTVLLMLAIDYYLNLSLLRKMAYENLVSLSRDTRPCWFSWLLFGLWPVMVLLGCLVQLLKTGKYYDHKEDTCCCCRKSDEPTVHLLSNKNDVIAKPWIQAPSTPSEKGDRYSPRNCDDDELYLMEDLTPV